MINVCKTKEGRWGTVHYKSWMPLKKTTKNGLYSTQNGLYLTQNGLILAKNGLHSIKMAYIQQKWLTFNKKRLFSIKSWMTGNIISTHIGFD